MNGLSHLFWYLKGWLFAEFLSEILKFHPGLNIALTNDKIPCNFSWFSLHLIRNFDFEPWILTFEAYVTIVMTPKITTRSFKAYLIKVSLHALLKAVQRSEVLDLRDTFQGTLESVGFRDTSTTGFCKGSLFWEIPSSVYHKKKYLNKLLQNDTFSAIKISQEHRIFHKRPSKLNFSFKMQSIRWKNQLHVMANRQALLIIILMPLLHADHDLRYGPLTT